MGTSFHCISVLFQVNRRLLYPALDLLQYNESEAKKYVCNLPDTKLSVFPKLETLYNIFLV